MPEKVALDRIRLDGGGEYRTATLHSAEPGKAAADFLTALQDA